VVVVGEAVDGDEAITRTVQLKPDVITMDVRMPKRSGLEAIREIMQVAPTPIVVISAAANDVVEGISFQALKLGAIEVLEKPQKLGDRFDAQANAIRQAVRAVAGLKLITRHRREPEAPPRPAGGRRGVPVCIGIAASTGGPPALQRVLSALPARYPVPILVVQHIAEGFCAGLVKWLAGQCAIQVRMAERGETPAPGTALVAPDGAHLIVSMGKIRLDTSPPVKSLRPSGTVLFASLAREYGSTAAGFVLTGMGDDGAQGLKLMREQGAFTAAQGPASSVVYGMPNVAMQIGAAEVSLELEDIAPTMLRLAGPAAPARKRLLLADDMETMLELERQLFCDTYELILARNGREALELAQRHRPDGILLDHAMPELTGLQVLEALRAIPATRTIPVLMVSSESSQSIQGLWRQAGCQGIVSKPVDKAVLAEMVRKLLA